MPDPLNQTLNYAPPPKRWPLPARITLTAAILMLSFLAIAYLLAPSAPRDYWHAWPREYSEQNFGLLTYLQITRTDPEYLHTVSTDSWDVRWRHTSYALHWPRLALTLALATTLLITATYFTRRLLRR